MVIIINKEKEGIVIDDGVSKFSDRCYYEYENTNDLYNDLMQRGYENTATFLISPKQIKVIGEDGYRFMFFDYGYGGSGPFDRYSVIQRSNLNKVDIVKFNNPITDDSFYHDIAVIDISMLRFYPGPIKKQVEADEPKTKKVKENE